MRSLAGFARSDVLCAHACFCGGFYNLDDVPEPEWLVTPESLVREVEPEMQVR